jgi:Leucine-rich repeat (LRR) protein
MLFNDFIQKKLNDARRKGIEYLHLETIRLAALSSNTFQNMPLLKSLKLENIVGNTTTLPENLFQGLNKLEHLELISLWLTELDETIFSNGLGKLKVLELKYNYFSTLPEKIFQRQHKLETLIIKNGHDNDNIPTFILPEQIFQGLTNLRHLDLSTSKLFKLPEHIFQGLTNLQHLNLSYSKLETLPETVFQGLTHLQKLELDGNFIITLPAMIFQGLASLQGIDLRDNELQELPATLFQGLTRLQEINLQDNKLQELPETIFHGLINLINLDISKNLITVLSRQTFAGLTKIKNIIADQGITLQEIEVDPFTKEDIQVATTDIKLAETKTADNNNVLLYACRVGDYANALLIAELMQEHDSKNISIQNAKGETALNYLLQNNTNSDLYALLLHDFLEKYDPTDECVVCNELMDGIKGPDERANAKGNDVITVCKNSHRFHRDCILGSCRVSQLNVTGQMNMDAEYYEPMIMNKVCPLCKEPLLPNCEGFVNKIKLPFPLGSTTGGRRKRMCKKYKKKTQKYKKKSKKYKKKSKKYKKKSKKL